MKNTIHIVKYVLTLMRLYKFHFIITLLGYVEIFWLLFLHEITLWVTNACLRTFHYLGTMLYLFIATICVTLTKVQIKFSSNDVVRTAICTCTHYVEHRYPILLFYQNIYRNIAYEGVVSFL